MRTGRMVVACAVATVGVVVGAPIVAPAATPDVTVSFGSGDIEPLVPARLLDTRDGTGAPAGPVGPGSTTVLQVAGRGGVPLTGAGAVVLNVTSTQPTEAGYVTVYPTGVDRPLASNLNVPPGATVPNLVVAKLGVGGTVSIYNSHGQTHLVADVTGWFPETSGLQPATPERLLDTRVGIGAPVGAVGPGSTTRLDVAGRAGIPDDGVAAVVFNLTVTEPSEPGYVTAYPTGGERPVASNVNFMPGTTVPNLVVAKVGADGAVDLFNAFGHAHLIADVAGWFPESAAFEAVHPERLLDTRIGLGAPSGALAAGATIPLQVAGRGPVPAIGAGAVVLNVTVTEPSANGYVTAYPAGVTRPTASNLNFGPGQTVANLVVAKLGVDGVVDLFNSHGASHLVADVVGWFPESNGPTTSLALKPGTLLAGPGDVLAATGTSDTGGTVTLSASADIPPVGGYLALAPQRQAPTGMFGRVTAVHAENGATVVALAAGPLGDAFDEIRVDTAEPAALTTAGTVGRSRAAKCEGGGGLSVSPTASFTLDSADFDFDLRAGTAYLLVGGTAEVGLSASFSGQYACASSGPAIPVPLGIVAATVEPSLSISVSAALTTSATVTGSVQLGFEKTGDGTRNLSDFGVSADGDLDAEATASVTFRPSFRTEVKLFGVAGATIDLGVDVTGTVEPLALPCVNLTAQASVEIGFEVGKWGVEWNATLARLSGPMLTLYERSAGCPTEGTAWVGHIDVSYSQDEAQQKYRNSDGEVWMTYTWERSYAYRIESTVSSLVNRTYVAHQRPADITSKLRSYSETTNTTIVGSENHPCNAHYAKPTSRPEESFFTELLLPDTWEMTDSPADGETVYLLVANFAGITDYCSDGSYANLSFTQAHLGDELDIDFACLAPAVPVGERGYCALPLQATEGGTRLRFTGTLSGTHHSYELGTPARQTVSIDLRKITNVP